MIRPAAGTPPWGLDLIRQIESEFINLALRPVKIPTYVVADLPSPSAWNHCLIYVSNETGGAVPAFSDGADWRRVTDRAIVS